MTLKRRRVKNNGRANYPTAAEALANRRKFLKLLGRGLLGASVFGLAACTKSAGKMPVDADDRHWWSDGTMAPPNELDVPDTQLRPEAVEEYWAPDGLPSYPDEVDIPDTLVKPDVEEDHWELLGIPPLDVKEIDVQDNQAEPEVVEEHWEIAGDGGWLEL